MSLLAKLKALFKPTPKLSLKEIVNKELDRVLPNMIDGVLMETFEKNPKKQLNLALFRWALVLYFEKAWPDLGRKSSLACANDCIDGMGALDGYDLSASAAKELVSDYVSEHGEAA